MRDLQNGIGALRLLGYRFEHINSPRDDDLVLFGWFLWPQHHDRLLISGLGVAVATRVTRTGHLDPRDATWSCEGDAEAVVWALVDLPPPIE
ncbi:hypothetical protein [Kibdelosporangium phytohabitans]|uniref:Uncharacterized protein n=1 Tax=Kibdelosporangium phytohabitans TaxID=860235 RepID=A0A0N9HPB7_9PSEU|nr:hypothetical protein [Kibdelosporangium phytohabitans]ALG06298.1 hypothetical protein AOZ06_04595 [Kibdelosporangium phytohabitans]MBE1467414.1 hypothetical protein [Kibdelosporangium phytohabitans]